MGRSESEKGSRRSKKSKTQQEEAPEVDENEIAMMASKPSKKSKGSKKGSKTEKSKSSKKDSKSETASKGSGAGATDSDGETSKTSKRKKEIKIVEVPYGTPYTLEEQAKMTHAKVRDGLVECIQIMKSAQGMCSVERDHPINAHCAKLEKQAENIMEALEKDKLYIDEVRHHHNRISDLCDNTRAYNQDQLVVDLTRATNIRTQVLTIIRGKPPDYELDQEEQDDLKTVRNQLRRMFGGRKLPKNQGLPPAQWEANKEEQADLLNSGPGSFKAKSRAGALFGAEGEGFHSIEHHLRKPTTTQSGHVDEKGGSWTQELLK